MDAQESKQLFKRADRLYREERYGEALTVLDALDAAFPDTKNILMPRAMCLVHLGQLEHGRAIYERLVARHPAEKLQKLSNLLENAERQAQADAPMDALDAVLNVNASDLANARITASPMSVQEARKAQEAKSAAPSEPSGPNWGKWAVIGTGVAVVLLIVAVPLIIGGTGSGAPADTGTDGPTEMTRITAGSIEDLPPAEFQRFAVVLFLVGGPLFLVLLPLPIYLTLLFFGEFPRDTFWENYGIMLLYMLGIYILTSIISAVIGLFMPGGASGLGWLLAYLYGVHAAFELGFVRTMIFFGFNIAVVMIIEIPLIIGLMRLFYFDIPVTAFFG